MSGTYHKDKRSGKRIYENSGTYILVDQFLGLVTLGARALFADGRIRNVRTAASADTFFSIPARLTYRGAPVTGFVTVDKFDRVVFRAHTKHTERFPDLVWKD